MGKREAEGVRPAATEPKFESASNGPEKEGGSRVPVKRPVRRGVRTTSTASHGRRGIAPPADGRDIDTRPRVRTAAWVPGTAGVTGPSVGRPSLTRTGSTTPLDSAPSRHDLHTHAPSPEGAARRAQPQANTGDAAGAPRGAGADTRPLLSGCWGGGSEGGWVGLVFPQFWEKCRYPPRGGGMSAFLGGWVGGSVGC